MSKAERARISRVLELFARFVPVEFHGMLEEEGKICVWGHDLGMDRGHRDSRGGRPRSVRAPAALGCLVILRLPRRWRVEATTEDIGDPWDWSEVRPRGFIVRVFRVPDWRARYDEKVANEAIDARFPELAPDTTPFLDMLKRMQAEMPPRRFTWTGDGESL